MGILEDYLRCLCYPFKDKTWVDYMYGQQHVTLYTCISITKNIEITAVQSKKYIVWYAVDCRLICKSIKWNYTNSNNNGFLNRSIHLVLVWRLDGDGLTTLTTATGLTTLTTATGLTTSFKCKHRRNWAAFTIATEIKSGIIISLLMSPLLGHRLSLWITHKENEP
jgi:hypothetical protein